MFYRLNCLSYHYLQTDYDIDEIKNSWFQPELVELQPICGRCLCGWVGGGGAVEEKSGGAESVGHSTTVIL